MKFGISKTEWRNALRWRVCLHEAGHAVAHAAFGGALYSVVVHLNDKSTAREIRTNDLGVTAYNDKLADPENETVVTMAGHAAETLGGGDYYDFDGLVTEWRVRGEDSEDEFGFYPGETPDEIDGDYAEVFWMKDKTLRDALHRAAALLQDREYQVTLLALELFENSSLTGAHAHELIEIS